MATPEQQGTVRIPKEGEAEAALQAELAPHERIWPELLEKHGGDTEAAMKELPAALQQAAESLTSVNINNQASDFNEEGEQQNFIPEAFWETNDGERMIEDMAILVVAPRLAKETDQQWDPSSPDADIIEQALDLTRRSALAGVRPTSFFETHFNAPVETLSWDNVGRSLSYRLPENIINGAIRAGASGVDLAAMALAAMLGMGYQESNIGRNIRLMRTFPPASEADDFVQGITGFALGFSSIGGALGKGMWKGTKAVVDVAASTTGTRAGATAVKGMAKGAQKGMEKAEEGVAAVRGSRPVQAIPAPVRRWAAPAARGFLADFAFGDAEHGVELIRSLQNMEEGPLRDWTLDLINAHDEEIPRLKGRLVQGVVGAILGEAFGITFYAGGRGIAAGYRGTKNARLRSKVNRELAAEGVENVEMREIAYAIAHAYAENVVAARKLRRTNTAFDRFIARLSRERDNTTSGQEYSDELHLRRNPTRQSNVQRHRLAREPGNNVGRTDDIMPDNSAGELSPLATDGPGWARSEKQDKNVVAVHGDPDDYAADRTSVNSEIAAKRAEQEQAVAMGDDGRAAQIDIEIEALQGTRLSTRTATQEVNRNAKRRVHAITDAQARSDKEGALDAVELMIGDTEAPVPRAAGRQVNRPAGEPEAADMEDWTASLTEEEQAEISTPITSSEMGETNPMVDPESPYEAPPREPPKLELTPGRGGSPLYTLVQRTEKAFAANMGGKLNLAGLPKDVRRYVMRAMHNGEIPKERDSAFPVAMTETQVLNAISKYGPKNLGLRAEPAPARTGNLLRHEAEEAADTPSTPPVDSDVPPPHTDSDAPPSVAAAAAGPQDPLTGAQLREMATTQERNVIDNTEKAFGYDKGELWELAAEWNMTPNGIHHLIESGRLARKKKPEAPEPEVKAEEPAAKPEAKVEEPQADIPQFSKKATIRNVRAAARRAFAKERRELRIGKEDGITLSEGDLPRNVQVAIARAKADPNQTVLYDPEQTTFSDLEIEEIIGEYGPGRGYPDGYQKATETPVADYGPKSKRRLELWQEWGGSVEQFREAIDRWNYITDDQRAGYLVIAREKFSLDPTDTHEGIARAMLLAYHDSIGIGLRDFGDDATRGYMLKEATDAIDAIDIAAGRNPNAAYTYQRKTRYKLDALPEKVQEAIRQFRETNSDDGSIYMTMADDARWAEIRDAINAYIPQKGGGGTPAAGGAIVLGAGALGSGEEAEGVQVAGLGGSFARSFARQLGRRAEKEASEKAARAAADAAEAAKSQGAKFRFRGEIGEPTDDVQAAYQRHIGKDTGVEWDEAVRLWSSFNDNRRSDTIRSLAREFPSRYFTPEESERMFIAGDDDAARRVNIERDVLRSREAAQTAEQERQIRQAYMREAQDDRIIKNAPPQLIADAIVLETRLRDFSNWLDRGGRGPGPWKLGQGGKVILLAGALTLGDTDDAEALPVAPFLRMAYRKLAQLTPEERALKNAYDRMPGTQNVEGADFYFARAHWNELTTEQQEDMIRAQVGMSDEVFLEVASDTFGQDTPIVAQIIQEVRDKTGREDITTLVEARDAHVDGLTEYLMERSRRDPRTIIEDEERFRRNTRQDVLRDTNKRIIRRLRNDGQRLPDDVAQVHALLHAAAGAAQTAGEVFDRLTRDDGWYSRLTENRRRQVKAAFIRRTALAPDKLRIVDDLFYSQQSGSGRTAIEQAQAISHFEQEIERIILKVNGGRPPAEGGRITPGTPEHAARRAREMAEMSPEDTLTEADYRHGIEDMDEFELEEHLRNLQDELTDPDITPEAMARTSSTMHVINQRLRTLRGSGADMPSTPLRAQGDPAARQEALEYYQGQVELQNRLLREAESELETILQRIRALEANTAEPRYPDEHGDLTDNANQLHDDIRDYRENVRDYEEDVARVNEGGELYPGVPLDESSTPLRPDEAPPPATPEGATREEIVRRRGYLEERMQRRVADGIHDPHGHENDMALMELMDQELEAYPWSNTFPITHQTYLELAPSTFREIDAAITDDELASSIQRMLDEVRYGDGVSLGYAELAENNSAQDMVNWWRGLSDSERELITEVGGYTPVDAGHAIEVYSESMENKVGMAVIDAFKKFKRGRDPAERPLLIGQRPEHRATREGTLPPVSGDIDEVLERLRALTESGGADDGTSGAGPAGAGAVVAAGVLGAPEEREGVNVAGAGGAVGRRLIRGVSRSRKSPPPAQFRGNVGTPDVPGVVDTFRKLKEQADQATNAHSLMSGEMRYDDPRREWTTLPSYGPTGIPYDMRGIEWRTARQHWVGMDDNTRREWLKRVGSPIPAPPEKVGKAIMAAAQEAQAAIRGFIDEYLLALDLQNGQYDALVALYTRDILENSPQIIGAIMGGGQRRAHELGLFEGLDPNDPLIDLAVQMLRRRVDLLGIRIKTPEERALKGEKPARAMGRGDIAVDEPQHIGDVMDEATRGVRELGEGEEAPRPAAPEAPSEAEPPGSDVPRGTDGDGAPPGESGGPRDITEALEAMGYKTPDEQAAAFAHWLLGDLDIGFGQEAGGLRQGLKRAIERNMRITLTRENTPHWVPQASRIYRRWYLPYREYVDNARTQLEQGMIDRQQYDEMMSVISRSRGQRLAFTEAEGYLSNPERDPFVREVLKGNTDEIIPTPPPIAELQLPETPLRGDIGTQDLNAGDFPFLYTAQMENINSMESINQAMDFVRDRRTRWMELNSDQDISGWDIDTHDDAFVAEIVTHAHSINKSLANGPWTLTQEYLAARANSVAVGAGYARDARRWQRKAAEIQERLSKEKNPEMRELLSVRLKNAQEEVEKLTQKANDGLSRYRITGSRYDHEHMTYIDGELIRIHRELTEHGDKALIPTDDGLLPDGYEQRLEVLTQEYELLASRKTTPAVAESLRKIEGVIRNARRQAALFRERENIVNRMDNDGINLIADRSRMKSAIKAAGGGFRIRRAAAAIARTNDWREALRVMDNRTKLGIVDVGYSALVGGLLAHPATITRNAYGVLRVIPQLFARTAGRGMQRLDKQAFLASIHYAATAEGFMQMMYMAASRKNDEGVRVMHENLNPNIVELYGPRSREHALGDGDKYEHSLMLGQGRDVRFGSEEYGWQQKLAGNETLQSGLHRIMRIARIPGELNINIDNYFKVFHYQRELMEGAASRAWDEAVMIGKEGDTEWLDSRMQELMGFGGMPIPRDLQTQAYQKAQEYTFTEPVGIVSHKMERLREYSVLLKGITPFVTAVAGVARYELKQTPLMALEATGRHILRNGGPEAEEFKGRMAVLAMHAMSGADLWARGYLYAYSPHGSSERGTRDSFTQPYSLLMPDGTSQSLERLAPIYFGHLIGATAMQLKKDFQLSEEDYGNLVQHLLMVAAQKGEQTMWFNPLVSLADVASGDSQAGGVIGEFAEDVTNPIRNPIGRFQNFVEELLDPAIAEYRSHAPHAVQRFWEELRDETGWVRAYDHVTGQWTRKKWNMWGEESLRRRENENIFGISMNAVYPATRRIAPGANPGTEEKPVQTDARVVEALKILDRNGVGFPELTPIVTVPTENEHIGAVKVLLTPEMYPTYAEAYGQTLREIMLMLYEAGTFDEEEDPEKNNRLLGIYKQKLHPVMIQAAQKTALARVMEAYPEEMREMIKVARDDRVARLTGPGFGMDFDAAREIQRLQELRSRDRIVPDLPAQPPAGP